jgi:hypothetical protein
MVAGSAVQRCKFNEHQQLLMAASDILLKYIYMAESTILEQRNWQRIKEDKVQEQMQWQNYTCIKR